VVTTLLLYRAALALSIRKRRGSDRINRIDRIGVTPEKRRDRQDHGWQNRESTLA